MEFKTLEDRMLYYRSHTDYVLTKKTYVMIMLDGKNFSSKIKKKFALPFDDTFIDIMNRTAEFVCSQIQGSKLAYVQSDEISIVLTDFANDNSDCYYGNRLSKILSIAASLATSFFNKEILRNIVKTSNSNIVDAFDNEPLYQFDCKAWNLPTYNDVFAWFLYRQNDCIRNSKQQASHTYLSHKTLLGLKTDEQISLLKNVKNIDWNDYGDGKKFGRFIYKKNIDCSKIINGTEINFVRSIWYAYDGFELHTTEGRNKFNNMFDIGDLQKFLLK